MGVTMTAYADATYQSRNPLKRFASTCRFEMAASFVYGDVLDYGCADGYFSKFAAQWANFTNYEPNSGNAPDDGTPWVQSLDGVTQRFDCIAALEVLEHLPGAMIDRFFTDVRRLLKPGGRVIITVPVMIGPVGLLKIMVGLEGYSLTSKLRHLFGIMPKTRKLYNGLHEHDGFDYRALRRRLKAEFGDIEQTPCQFIGLPSWLNSQVCFVCSGPH